MAIDGCGAPVFYVPLKNIALGYARLAGAQPDSPAGLLMAAILAHPKHIAGDGRLETTVMEALPGKIFAKSGAEGGYGLSLMEGGLGVAFKIEDGSQRALNPTVVAILEQTGRAHPGGRRGPGRLPAAAHPQPPQRGGGPHPAGLCASGLDAQVGPQKVIFRPVGASSRTKNGAVRRALRVLAPGESILFAS